MSTSILAGHQVLHEPERIAPTAIEPWLKAWGSATIGHRVFLLNARRSASEGHQSGSDPAGDGGRHRIANHAKATEGRAMNDKENADSGPRQASDLRQEAERRLGGKKATPVEGMTEADVRALLHELQVHQIELEMQNEQLLSAQTAVQELSDKYHDLFDFAPVGYFRLDGQGRILEVNLAGASLLGLDRSTAVKQRFGQFVAMEYRAAFADFCKRVSATAAKQTCEIEIRRNEELVYAVVEGVSVQEGKGSRSLCVIVTDITERKRAEQEIARLASFPMFNPQPIVEVDMDGRVCFANPAAQCLFSDIQQLGPDHPWLSNWGSLANACREPSASLAARDVAVGERHYHQVMHYVPEVRRVRIYGEDITERIRAEEALRQSHDQLHAIYDSTLDGLLVTDIETKRFLRTNPAMCRMLGYSEEEILSISVMEIHPPDALPAILEQFQALADGRLPVAEGAALLAKDGTVLRADISGKCVVYDGRPCIIGFFHDITTRKRAEQELVENRQRLAGIVGSAMDAIISMDAAQRIVLFNAAAEKMFRCSAAEAIGQPLERFIPERFRAAHAGHVRAFGEAGTTSRAMGRLTSLSALRADGEEFPMEASISQGEVRGQKVFTVILRDITDRKRVEEALQRTAEELVRSNKDLQQFASVASHDLQEPLRTVTGFVQLLQKKYKNQLDPKADQFIEFVVDGAKRMETLIKDLLAYARVGSQGLELAATDAGAALRQAVHNLSMSIQETAAEITYGELPTVRADAGQLVQLFQNLLGNALKFRGEAPPRIHVDACRNEDHWLFSVRDNGIGIAPESLDRIFLIFERLHTRTQYPGTGIGLAICKRIVDRHGGRIGVESEPGRGTTFNFTLPT